MSAPQSNEQFLAEIFGPSPDGPRPWVCGFPGHPRDGNWSGAPWSPGIGQSDAAGLNWYFTLATYEPDPNGVTTRAAAHCNAIYGVLLDDLGSKAPSPESLSLPPSVVIETSTGNFQALYLFDRPATDLARVQALQNSLVSAGLCDPGAKSPATRYARLPFGVNGKHAPAHECRLAEWSAPWLRYSVDAITTGLGLEWAPSATKAGDRAPSPVWAHLSDAEQARVVVELRDALACIPADDRSVWVKVGMNLKGSLPEELASELWSEWSRTSPKFTDEGLLEFETFAPTQCDHRAVFSMAHQRGWQNPRSAAPLDLSTVGFGVGVVLPPGASRGPIATAEPAREATFKRVAIADLAHREIPPHVFWWSGYIPAGEVTLLAAHGGKGKSTIALMLAVCIAAGIPLFGVPVCKGRVLFFSAEDPAPTLARRLKNILRRLGVDPREVDKTLTVLDATDGDPTLYAETRATGGRLTKTFDALRHEVEAGAFDVVLVDNSSDTYGGDEINRAQVREFVRSLARLIRPRNGAVVLLAHVDKGTSRRGAKPDDDEGYSGSTAWNNSVRSRLFLVESSPGLLELRQQKCNLGPKQPKITLTWQGTLPAVIQAPDATDEDLTASLLRCVGDATNAGRRLSPAPNSPYYAVKVLELVPGYPKGLDRTKARALLDAAEREGRLVLMEKLDGARNSVKSWVLPKLADAA